MSVSATGRGKQCAWIDVPVHGQKAHEINWLRMQRPNQYNKIVIE
jgi:hypothetical protein